MKQKLPDIFRPLLWAHDFSRIDPEKYKKTIIVLTLNYGTLEHWRWIKRYYGTSSIQRMLARIPASEIRPRARRLASLMSLADSWNHAPRSSH